MKAVSGKRMVRLLEQRGWVAVRIRGSHHAMQHPDRDEVIVVPVHSNRDLKSGTQRGIMKVAELDDSDL